MINPHQIIQDAIARIFTSGRKTAPELCAEHRRRVIGDKGYDKNARIKTITITFQEPVELTAKDQDDLVDRAALIAYRYSLAHPGRAMWPSSIGFAMLTNPFLVDDGHPLEFDLTAFSIECFERADYDCPCSICGLPQGDHEGHITNPPAGKCEFACTEEKS